MLKEGFFTKKLPIYFTPLPATLAENSRAFLLRIFCVHLLLHIKQNKEVSVGIVQVGGVVVKVSGCFDEQWLMVNCLSQLTINH
ncbi:MAG: hypothetical protein LUM44_20300 [Pyrinomonadaceae bacterium]|nr:hypothetical protein [Pyrinomonadaceae bacterium]